MDLMRHYFVSAIYHTNAPYVSIGRIITTFVEAMVRCFGAMDLLQEFEGIRRALEGLYSMCSLQPH